MFFWPVGFQRGLLSLHSCLRFARYTGKGGTPPIFEASRPPPDDAHDDAPYHYYDAADDTDVDDDDDNDVFFLSLSLSLYIHIYI